MSHGTSCNDRKNDLVNADVPFSFTASSSSSLLEVANDDELRHNYDAISVQCHIVSQNYAWE